MREIRTENAFSKMKWQNETLQQGKTHQELGKGRNFKSNNGWKHAIQVKGK